MSLNWDIKTAIEREGKEALTGDKEWPVTEGLIWATMILDIGTIETEDEVDEFMWRMRYYEGLFGCLNQKWDEDKEEWVDHPITKEEVMVRRGLRTNVMTKSREYFVLRQAENFQSRNAPERTREQHLRSVQFFCNKLVDMLGEHEGFTKVRDALWDAEHKIEEMVDDILLEREGETA